MFNSAVKKVDQYSTYDIVNLFYKGHTKKAKAKYN